MFPENELVDVFSRWREGEASLVELVKELFSLLGTYLVIGSVILLLYSFKIVEHEVFKNVGIFLVAIPSLLAVRRLMSVVNRLEALYKKESDPNLRLKNALLELLGEGGKNDLPPHARHVAKQCEGLVASVSALLKDEDAWARQRYVQFVSSLVESIVGRNADELSKLADNDRSERKFEVPKSAAELADQILEAQMQELKGADSYCVISDLGSWQGGQLERFFAETERAVVSRGVRVKRIFNLALQNQACPENAGDILRKHLSEANKWRRKIVESGRSGGYYIKVVREKDLTEIARRDSTVQVRRVASSQTAHFGIFTHEDERIRFRVEEEDLSIMKLCRHKEEVDGSLRFFNSLWNQAPDLTEDIVRDIEKWISDNGQRRPTRTSSPSDGDPMSLQGL